MATSNTGSMGLKSEDAASMVGAPMMEAPVIDAPMMEAPMTGIALLLTEQAFRQREPKIRGVKELREGQFDVNNACTRFFGAMPQIKNMRPLIEENFRKFDMEAFDDFEGRVHAAHYCNAMWLSKISTKIDVTALAAELDLRIRRFTRTCEMLVEDGVVAPEQLKPLGEDSGYAGKVNDATLLLGILRRVAPEALARTIITPAELATTEVTLLTFQSSLGKRQVLPVEREEASLLRQQSITYMLQSFDVALKAAIYLYGEVAGKQVVPSPYADRGRKSGKAGDDEPEAPAGEAASNGAPAPNAFVVTNPTGLPLSNPFEEDKK